MYLPSLFFGILIFCPAITIAAQPVTPANSTEPFTTIPSCSRECLINAYSSPEDNCTLANPQCLCTINSLLANISECTQRHCNLTELAPLQDVYLTFCEGFPVESRDGDLRLANILLALFVLPAVGLRCYSRYVIGRELWWDDWTIVVAGLGLIGMVITDILDTNYGFGRHLWAIPLANARPMLQIYIVDEVLYIVVLAATKVSVLMFYHRLFQRPLFRKIVILNVGFIVLTGIAFVFVMIFQCNPVNGFWDKTVPSTCINTKKVAYAISGFSIVQDILVLIIPIPEVATLQMSTKKKWSVMVMFGLGGLACVTSIIRLKYLLTFGNSLDPSWDDVTPSVWSLIELGVAIICACLPAIRALINHYVPGLLDLGSRPNSRRTSKIIDKGTSSTRASRSISRFASHNSDEERSRIGETHDNDVSDSHLAQDIEGKVGKTHADTIINIKLIDTSALKSPAPIDGGEPDEYGFEYHRPRTHERISNESFMHIATAIPMRRVG